jgi:hypothetical protein
MVKYSAARSKSIRSVYTENTKDVKIFFGFTKDLRSHAFPVIVLPNLFEINAIPPSRISIY